MTEQEDKEVVKQAIKEWMNERYSEIGKWTVKTILVAGLTSLLFWYVQVRGFHFP